jgi:4-amino-4-deoxy-L-arabinose transferase-like glycosyltransferase
MPILSPSRPGLPLSALQPARRRWLLASIGLASLLAQALFLSALPSRWAENENYDYRVIYEPAARSLLNGTGLIGPDGRFLVHYPPGYPLALAGVFGVARITGLPDPAALRALAAAAAVLSAVLVYLIAEMFCPWPAAAGAALLWITYPFHLWIFKQPNAEGPFIPLFLGAVLAWTCSVERAKPWYAAAAGVLAGLATLVRPIGLGLGPVLVLATLVLYRRILMRRRLLLAAFLIAGNILVVAPWEILAHQRVGRWIPVATSGTGTMLIGLTSAVNPTSSGDPPHERVSLPVRRLMQKIQAERPVLERLSGVAVLRFAARNADARTLAELLAVKAARTWYATDSQRLEDRILLLQMPYILLFVFGAVVSWRASGGPRRMAALAAGVILYFWAMSILAAALLRYIVPAISLLTIPAAFGVFQVVSRLRAGTAGGASGPAGAGGAARSDPGL